MKDYAVLFIQPIWDHTVDRPPTFMEKKLHLPFIPFVGLEVVTDKFKTLKPIQRILWRSELGQFWVYCPDDLSLREDVDKTAFDKFKNIDELVSMYLSYGWEKGAKKS